MRIALFVTCLADGLFPSVGQATVTVLERLGHEVVFPDRQTCCGQMHTNTGYPDHAAPLARHFADVLAGYDPWWPPAGRASDRCATSTPPWPTGWAIPSWRPASGRWPSGPTSCRSSCSTSTGQPTSAPTARAP